jgi:hypothetical protein
VDQDLMMDFLTRLMELYVNMGLEVKKKTDRETSNRSKSKGNLGEIALRLYISKMNFYSLGQLSWQ